MQNGMYKKLNKTWDPSATFTCAPVPNDKWAHKWERFQMEALVQRMLDEQQGVPIKTVKSFLSKVPSVFTGQDLVAWIMKHVPVSDLCKSLFFSLAVFPFYSFCFNTRMRLSRTVIIVTPLKKCRSQMSIRLCLAFYGSKFRITLLTIVYEINWIQKYFSCPTRT